MQVAVYVSDVAMYRPDLPLREPRASELNSRQREPHRAESD